MRVWKQRYTQRDRPGVLSGHPADLGSSFKTTLVSTVGMGVSMWMWPIKMIGPGGHVHQS